MDIVRIKNTINGVPRYAVHFFELLSDKEQVKITKDYFKNHGTNFGSLDAMYKRAIYLSKAIGGKKYKGKDMGGMITFQSYNKRELIEDIQNIRGGE